MKKRIGIVMARQHYTGHGGIGQFAKGLGELAEKNDCIVDIITEKKLDPFWKPNGTIFTQESETSLKNHRRTFSFKDSMRFEAAADLRDAMMVAFQSVLYDLIILQSPETLLPLCALGIQHKIPVVYYTHHENLIYPEMTTPTFTDAYLDMSRKLMQMDNIIVGTQTERNMNAMKEQGINSVKLPMPITEDGLLTPSRSADKEGVMFIGRWEERKNPGDFLKAIKGIDLPVKVLTAPHHVDRVIEDLKKIGITNYDVRGGLYGDDKVNFIKSAKVTFMPSKRENYSFALLESISQNHSILLKKYDWWKNFPTELLHIAKDPKDAHNMILKLHEEDIPQKQNDFIIQHQKDTWGHWQKILDMPFPNRTSNRSRVAEMAKDGFYYDEYVKSANRFNSIEDVITCYNAWDNWDKVQLENRTWISSKENPLPPRTDSFSELFDI